MPTFTAFCQEKGASGTIWIDQVEAESADLATLEAGLKCAADWGFEPCDVWVLGIARGNVEILIWEDQGVP
jgi:hypothetical protein